LQGSPVGEGILIVNCREALDHFGEYLDGELTSTQRWRLRVHLWICGQCRKYLRSYRATVALERAAFEGDDGAQAPVPDELVKTILSAAHIAPASGDGNPPPPAK
jgi:anti-sigma factor RsiW